MYVEKINPGKDLNFFLFPIVNRSGKKKKNSSHTLSVRIPLSKALESVSKRATTLRVAIRRQASDTVVVSGTVKAFESRSDFTVLSPANPLIQVQNKQRYHRMI